MKKIILSVIVCVACTMITSCGGFGQPMTNGSTSQTSSSTTASTIDALGNIISGIIGSSMTSQASLVGTWTYTQPCVQFESENLLAQAGGAMVASQVQSKLGTYYSKLGIRPGACTFVFGNNGTLTYQIGNIQNAGTYTFDSASKTVMLTTQTGMTIKAYVTVTGTAMGLTFDTSKFLSLLGTAASASSSLSSISSVVGQYSGMKLGFQFFR